MNNALVPSKDEFDIIQTIAKTASESKYFDKLGGPAGVMSIALYAREIGVPPMTALMGGFTNVMGKITMSAELMHSLIRQSGHKLKIMKSTNEVCEIWGKRKDTGEEYTAVYHIDDAKRAFLVKKDGGWEKNPSDMLFARCISRLRRRLFPDVATKSYVEGEFDEKDTFEQGPTITVESTKETNHVEVLQEFFKRFQQYETEDGQLRYCLDSLAESKKMSAGEYAKMALQDPVRFEDFFKKWVLKQAEENAKLETVEAKLV